MSIASEITRLQTAKADLKTAIEGKGVTVPSASLLDDYADLVDDIPSGGGNVDFTDKTWPTGQVSSDKTETWQYMFYNRVGITHVSLPQITTMPASMFQGCSALQSVYLPKATFVGYAQNQFNGCSSLVGIVIPTSTGVYGSAFLNCTAMTYADINLTGFNQPNVLNGCTNISTLVLRHTSVAALNNINVFGGTPFASGGTGGILYVPNDLISTYEQASNWSTILGYPNNQIKSIESTHTDPNAPIDLTLYYADGTPIPTS